MHVKKVVEAGLPLAKAKKALIMLHGRGAAAEDILSLRHELLVDDFYIVAPQAANYTWYPVSFMAPVQQNEPWLSSAIDLLSSVVEDITKRGIAAQQIFILGFSQGACLSLEFATRYAQQWGGVIAFTGGLIGAEIDPNRYTGKFEGTKIFIGNSDQDPHVPLLRSEKSGELMSSLGANVTLNVYPGMPHTINRDEILRVNTLFFGSK